MSEAQMLGEVARDALRRERWAHRHDAAWGPLLEGGWIGVGVEESAGGGGGGLAEACALAHAAGVTASASPVVETILAALMLGRTDAGPELLPQLAEGDQRATLALAEPLTPATRRDDGAVLVPAGVVVPHGAGCTVVVVLVALGEVEIGASALPRDALELTPGANVAGEPRDVVAVPSELTAPVHRIAGGRAGAELAIAALTAARTLGALTAAHELSVAYARDRRQFGRSIGSFQAIAHTLVGQAGDVAQAEAAVAAAALAEPPTTTGAVARVLADRAAARVAASAHQVHGAIGTTHEHDLHRFTLRLMAWPGEYGAARRWRRRLGETVAARGPAWWDGRQPAPDAAA